MKPMTKFILTYTWKNLWFRWNCFGLFYSGRINTVLLWSMVLSVISCYGMMSWFLEPHEMEATWHHFFSTHGIFNVASSLMVYSLFGRSRNAGLATIWMLYSGVNFFVTLLDLQQYFAPVSFVMKAIMVFIAIHILFDIYKRSNAKGVKKYHTLHHRGCA